MQADRGAEERREREVRRGIRHARARWIGILLVPVSLGLLIGSAWSAICGNEPFYYFILALAGCVLSVVVFGTHSDTALALLHPMRGHPAIPPLLARELDSEFLFHRLDLYDLKATPITSWVMTLLEVVLLFYILWRLLT